MNDKNNFGNKSFLLKIFILIVVLIFLPLILIVGIIYYAWGFILSVAIWIIWGLKGRHILFVYSNSPIWSKYIEEGIIPYIQEKAIILNWSERKGWKISLAVLAFNHFGGSRNFNPLAIIFKPFRFNREFRFYEAFKEYKHGKTEKLEKIKKEFFDMIS
ncbi:MAG: hypothetical protein JNK81_07960 [Anaerolineales bacterium]|nr:hypothetical protein [Anaerolineales bacterium]